jgi:ribosomal protein S18 acetylase RimI-like enzyme
MQDDLRRMQSLQQELWALEGPRVLAHVGDLAWWSTMHTGREAEWKRQLWLDGDRCVAWSWLKLPATMDYEVHREHRGGRVHHDLLDWFEANAAAEGPLSTFAMEDDHEWIAVLEAKGYTHSEPYDSYGYHVQDLDGSLQDPEVPENFTLRTVRGEGDLHERVEVHRTVWAPSRVSEESFRNVMSVWPYRADLDCVLEGPDGTFAAYVLCWYDEQNAVGEFEPVGTHPDHRRRGFGAAVCRYALRRLQEEGARRAIVYAGGRAEDAGARALYESVGFRCHARVVEFRKDR